MSIPADDRVDLMRRANDVVRASDDRMRAHATRLITRYGVDRAAAIITGRDPATQADIAAWRRLGAAR